MLKLYFQFPYWPFHRRQRVSLHLPTTLCPNWIMVSYQFTRWRPHRRKSTSGFSFNFVWCLRIPKAIGTPNFDEISSILTFLTFSWQLALWFCIGIGLPSSVKCAWSPTTIWSHIDFAGCVSHLLLVYGLWFGHVSHLIRSKPIHTPNFDHVSIHGRDFTTSGFWKETAAMLKF